MFRFVAEKIPVIAVEFLVRDVIYAIFNPLSSISPYSSRTILLKDFSRENFPFFLK